MKNLVYRKYIEKPPKYVYKYYSNLNYAKDVLINHRIHLECPREYNDIFDSAQVFDESDLQRCPYHKGIMGNLIYWMHRDYKEKVKQILEGNSFERMSIADILVVLGERGIPQEVIELLKHLIISNCINVQPSNNKISCFSENYDSLLLWAHYGNCLGGVCLCFDTEKDPVLFSHLQRVRYTEKRSKERNFNLYFSKSVDWAYEREWRIVVDTEEEYISTNSCVGVIIGQRCPVVSKNHSSPDSGTFYFCAMNNNQQVFYAIADKDLYKINITEYPNFDLFSSGIDLENVLSGKCL